MESFHGRFRDEGLNREQLWILTEARVVIEDYRVEKLRAVERDAGRVGHCKTCVQARPCIGVAVQQKKLLVPKNVRDGGTGFIVGGRVWQFVIFSERLAVGPLGDWHGKGELVWCGWFTENFIGKSRNVVLRPMSIAAFKFQVNAFESLGGWYAIDADALAAKQRWWRE